MRGAVCCVGAMSCAGLGCLGVDSCLRRGLDIASVQRRRERDDEKDCRRWCDGEGMGERRTRMAV